MLSCFRGSIGAGDWEMVCFSCPDKFFVKCLRAPAQSAKLANSTRGNICNHRTRNRTVVTQNVPRFLVGWIQTLLALFDHKAEVELELSRKRIVLPSKWGTPFPSSCMWSRDSSSPASHDWYLLASPSCSVYPDIHTVSSFSRVGERSICLQTKSWESLLLGSVCHICSNHFSNYWTQRQ